MKATDGDDAGLSQHSFQQCFSVKSESQERSIRSQSCPHHRYSSLKIPLIYEVFPEAIDTQWKMLHRSQEILRPVGQEELCLLGLAPIFQKSEAK